MPHDTYPYAVERTPIMLHPSIQSPTGFAKITPNVNVKVTVKIPATSGGYTGQRDQWETHGTEAEVKVADSGNIELHIGSRIISFENTDLIAALRVLQGPPPPATRGDQPGLRPPVTPKGAHVGDRFPDPQNDARITR